MSNRDKPSMDESSKAKAGKGSKGAKNSEQRQNVDLNEKPEAAEADTQSEFTKAEQLRNRQ